MCYANKKNRSNSLKTETGKDEPTFSNEDELKLSIYKGNQNQLAIYKDSHSYDY